MFKIHSFLNYNEQKSIRKRLFHYGFLRINDAVKTLSSNSAGVLKWYGSSLCHRKIKFDNYVRIMSFLSSNSCLCWELPPRCYPKKQIFNRLIPVQIYNDLTWIAVESLKTMNMSTYAMDGDLVYDEMYLKISSN